jgi:hypothetical protein
VPGVRLAVAASGRYGPPAEVVLDRCRYAARGRPPEVLRAQRRELDRLNQIMEEA